MNVLVKKGLGVDEINVLVSPYFTWVSAPIDALVIARALHIFERYKTSWWDGLMIAWAAQAGCSVLLTEDRQGAPVIEGVTILSPFSVEPTADFDLNQLRSI